MEKGNGYTESSKESRETEKRIAAGAKNDGRGSSFKGGPEGRNQMNKGRG